LKKDFITNKLRPAKKPGLDSVAPQRHVETIQGEKFSWIDLQNPDRRDVEQLAQKYNLNALNVSLSSTSSNQRNAKI
jgi:magnesium transporter